MPITIDITHVGKILHFIKPQQVRLEISSSDMIFDPNQDPPQLTNVWIYCRAELEHQKMIPMGVNVNPRLMTKIQINFKRAGFASKGLFNMDIEGTIIKVALFKRRGDVAYEMSIMSKLDHTRISNSDYP